MKEDAALVSAAIIVSALVGRSEMHISIDAPILKETLQKAYTTAMSVK